MRRPDQMTRAGDYVLGLMDDVERERAERDLEIDPAFREAVIGIAERMRLLDPAGQARDGDAGDDANAWRVISARIAEMPQMRAARTAVSTATSSPTTPRIPPDASTETWPEMWTMSPARTNGT